MDWQLVASYFTVKSTDIVTMCLSITNACQFVCVLLSLLILRMKCISSWPRGYKTFFVLNSVEHEISNAHKYKNIKKFGLFNAQLSLECYFSRSYMLKCQQLLAF